jgi:hypothetical protein
MSSEIEPVEIASTFSVAVEPSFIIDPFPNCFSIWLIAVSIAFCLSTILFLHFRAPAPLL